MIDAILLAAGSSRRMGEKNKLLMPYSDSSIIKQVASQVSKSKINKLIVVLGYDHKPIMESLQELKQIEFVYNSIHTFGQMSSIQAAMSLIDKKQKGFMICLGDMPTLTTEEYNLVIDGFLKNHSPKRITRPVYKEQIGHPVIFDSLYRKEIIDTSKFKSCKSIIEKNKGHLEKIEVSSVNFFLDIDNPSDYKRLMKYSDQN